MSNSLLVCLVAILFSSPALAQYHWVQFTNKIGTPYSIDRPFDFLSEKSISRRVSQEIELNETDLPINPEYRRQVLSVADVAMHNQSKWLNGLCIITENPNSLDEIRTLSFVDYVETLREKITGKHRVALDSKFEALEASEEEVSQFHHGVDYGSSFRQLEVYNLLPLHEKGYTGKGLVIGVMDAGYNQLFEIPGFRPMIEDGRLLGQRDFVDNQHEEISGSFHGMSVMSCMAGNSEGKIIGAAPDASYWIFRTEDGGSETRVEEINWAAAAEYGDSVGCDIFNTSLGYTLLYDDTGAVDSLRSYYWDDLNGNTSYITRAADMAAQKGILVVNSAGNSGQRTWKYIGMPADGDSVMAIGAVDSSVAKNKTGFSSFGRGSDPRVKPNVMAQGSTVALLGLDSTGNDLVVRGGGTSFAGPLLAGAAACLWQMDKSKSAWEIKTFIEESADRFSNPDTAYGYGIPDFNKAGNALVKGKSEEAIIDVFPNPIETQVSLKLYSPTATMLTVEIFDPRGRLIQEMDFELSEGANTITAPVGDYLGLLLLRAYSEHHQLEKKLLQLPHK